MYAIIFDFDLTLNRTESIT